MLFHPMTLPRWLVHIPFLLFHPKLFPGSLSLSEGQKQWLNLRSYGQNTFPNDWRTDGGVDLKCFYFFLKGPTLRRYSRPGRGHRTKNILFVGQAFTNVQWCDEVRWMVHSDVCTILTMFVRFFLSLDRSWKPPFINIRPMVRNCHFHRYWRLM